MHDAGKVMVGLVIFLAVVTLPLVYFVAGIGPEDGDDSQGFGHAGGLQVGIVHAYRLVARTPRLLRKLLTGLVKIHH